MRLSYAILFATQLVFAFTVIKRGNALPTCATTCGARASPSPCNITDTACLCVNQNYTKAINTCITGSCNSTDAGAAAAANEASCKAAGIDPQNPFPPCGVVCVQNAPRGTCTDQSCLCKSYDYVNSIISCFAAACISPDVDHAELAGEAVCRAAGVDISAIINASS